MKRAVVNRLPLVMVLDWGFKETGTAFKALTAKNDPSKAVKKSLAINNY